MADNTHLKDLAGDVKKILELMESRNKDYSLRFSSIEIDIEGLRLHKPDHVEGSSVKLSAPPFQVRNVKLDFPRFDGQDALQWIFKVEQLFEYYATPDDQRITIAAIHFDKEVLPWFQMARRMTPFGSWRYLTRELELEFGPSPYECPRLKLFKLIQSDTMNDYYMQFTALANRVQGVTPDALLDCFVGGL